MLLSRRKACEMKSYNDDIKRARKEMTAGGAGDSGAAELTHVRKAALES